MPRLKLLLLILLLAALASLLAGWLRPQTAVDLEFARQRWQAGAVERDVQAAGHRWRVLEAGEGPVLVLVHGFTGMKENWLPVMRDLSQRHRVLAPDLPGWGESERHADAVYGFPEQAGYLAQFIEAVAGDAPIDLVGHSMGGGIAAMLAAEHPRRVARLVLMDAAGVPFENDFAKRVIAGEHPFEVTDRASVYRQLNLVFDHPPFLMWPADTAIAEYRRAQIPFEKAVLRAITGSEALAFAPGEAARQIKAPTLLLWCRNDRVIDIAAAAIYRERIPMTETVLIDDCNHMPMMEQAEATASALDRFFD